MKLQDFDYALPHELIAQVPAPDRTASRLLHLDAPSGAIHDRRFRDAIGLFSRADVVVMNDTRVIKARLIGRKSSGGRIELLVERVLAHDEVLAQVKASHKPKAGSRIILADAVEATVLESEGGFARLRFDDCEDIHALLERHGSVPLPPYIGHTPDAADEARYQTVYARERGAVAAPTAGLHFDEATLEALREKGVALAYVTLHVGAGTFQPVRTDDLSHHEMHSEWYRVPQETVDAIARAKECGGRVIAVGTTTLRALESAAVVHPSTAPPVGSRPALQPGARETRLFIMPGYRFRVVDRLITNFHLPKSTLLMLVAAFAGMENTRRAYAHAIEQRYRFFSYGDAMLIERVVEPEPRR
jgi:S-adenosylmethionine:tRNA ribosyltransferase-isomerase